MDMDFNTAEKQVSFELIPAGTLAPIMMSIKFGGHGSDGSLTQSKTSDVLFLNVEFTVMEGAYAKRKIFQNLTVSGGGVDDKGRSKGGTITKSFLRAVIDSAYGLDPDDDSPASRQKRIKNSYGDFNQMIFLGKVGIETGKNGYAAKNKILEAITKGHKSYGDAASSPAPAVATPAFAQAQASPAPTGATGNALPSWAR